MDKKQQNRLEEVTTLLKYHKQLSELLADIHQKDTSSVLSIKVNPLPLKTIAELSVFDEKGQVINWDETGFPTEMKRMAFRIFPNAVLEKQKEFKHHLDFDVRSTFLINLLTYLYAQVNQRIELLQKELLNGHKN